jgi:hypothetical protein
MTDLTVHRFAAELSRMLASLRVQFAVAMSKYKKHNPHDGLSLAVEPAHP